MILKMWSPENNDIIIVTRNLLEMQILRPHGIRHSGGRAQQAVFNNPPR